MKNRKHNSRCEHANPNSICKCSCGGKLHGIAFIEKDKNTTIDKYLKDMDNGETFIK